MILTNEQQRWCHARMLGSGYDDDDPNMVQYKHVCEYVGGDGDELRPALAKHMTRKKLVRVRRARNAWARLLSVSIGTRPKTLYATDAETGELAPYVLQKGLQDTAHYWRGRENEANAAGQFETSLPKRNPYCSSCRSWIGRHGHQMCGDGIQYCRACCMSGANDRDDVRRAVARQRRQQKLAYPRQTYVAMCRSPRLWCSAPGWPALDDAEQTAEQAAIEARWAEVTCIDCLKLLRERGCPGMPEVHGG